MLTLLSKDLSRLKFIEIRGKEPEIMETEDMPLSVAMRNEKKVEYISKDKISLSFCNITRIDRVPYPYNKVTKLHISHNKISTLDGIEQFQLLEQLSLSYNRIEDLSEFYKVSNRHRIKELSVRGNPLTSHPDYLIRLIEIFPTVYRIDDLIIEARDRKYLRDYERICGFIIPFYLSIQRDIETATRCLNRLNEIQRSKDERATQSTFWRGDAFEIDPNGAKLLETLKNNLSHPELLSALNLSQKVDLNTAIRLTTDRGPIFILRNIVALISSLYPNFDHIEEEESNTLYEAYRAIFSEIMLQYHEQGDNSLDIFLTNQVLQNSNYDLERFSNDSAYAFECILLEFYKLMPSQAFFTENIIADSKASEKRKVSSRYSKEEGKKISPLDITTTDPDYLKTVWLAHFPIFPLNKQYLANLYAVLRSHVFRLESTCTEFFETFQKVFDVPNNELEAMTLGSLRVHPKEGQTGFSTRDSGFVVDEEERQRQRASKRGSKYWIGSLPEEKSVLPLLLFVKLSDKANELKSQVWKRLKQLSGPSRIMKLTKKQSAEEKKARIKKIQDLLLAQQLRKKREFFDALKSKCKFTYKMADEFYKKNLYLKSICSILKVIAQKRGALSNLLNKLDERLYYEKKNHFEEWKMLSKAERDAQNKGIHKFGGKSVKFGDENDGLHVCTHGSRTSRGSRRAFEAWDSSELGYHTHRNIFRKCLACDSFPVIMEKLL